MILTSVATSEAAGVLLGLLYIIILLGFVVLYGFLIYWTIKFLTQVPNHLNRIANALERIAKK